MELKIASKQELIDQIQTLPITPMRAILFGGDRLMVTDWGILAMERDTLIGLGSVADQGEMLSGEPTIIGIMVMPDWRRMGIGSQILRALVQEAGRLGRLPLLYEALTPSGQGLAQASGYGPEDLIIRNFNLGVELP